MSTVLKRLIMNKTCNKCNKSFECTSDEQCWCMKEYIVEIDTVYDDCLCSDCLHNKLNKSKKNN